MSGKSVPTCSSGCELDVSTGPDGMAAEPFVSSQYAGSSEMNVKENN